MWEGDERVEGGFGIQYIFFPPKPFLFHFLDLFANGILREREGLMFFSLPSRAANNLGILQSE